MKIFVIKATLENQAEVIAKYETIIEAEDKLLALKQEFPQAEYSICELDVPDSNESDINKPSENIHVNAPKPLVKQKSPWAFDLDEYLANREKYKK